MAVLRETSRNIILNVTCSVFKKFIRHMADFVFCHVPHGIDALAKPVVVQLARVNKLLRDKDIFDI